MLSGGKSRRVIEPTVLLSRVPGEGSGGALVSFAWSLVVVRIMDSLSIAIVGCGSFGQQIANLLERLPCLKIVAVCDPDEAGMPSIPRGSGR